MSFVVAAPVMSEVVAMEERLMGWWENLVVGKELDHMERKFQCFVENRIGNERME